MEKLKVSEYLNNIEKFETHNIVRFSAFIIYLEFVLRYFYKTSCFNFATPTALYEFVFANWLTLIFAWLAYYPIQNLGKQTYIALGQLLFNLFWKLQKKEREEYRKMDNERFIISLDVAEETVRRYSDKKLEKEIEQILELRKKNAVVKMRLGIIFTLLLINALLFWLDYSSVELILKTNLLQILALLMIGIWTGYSNPESFEYVCRPTYLTVKEI